MMHQIKHLLEAYFVFTRRERIALFILIGIVFIVIFIANQMSKKITVTDRITMESKTLKTELDKKNNERDKAAFSGNYHRKVNQRWGYKNRASSPKRALFVFNPNTADAEEWLKLGVKESVVNTIMKYREKGGLFQKPEDLRRIFGLSPTFCEALIPFVRIPENQVTLSKPASAFRQSRKSVTNININEATLEDWKMLEGIGPGYAQRIINFREKLGGFYSIEQVAETYGLPDSIFQKIKPWLVFSNGPYRTINLNEVSSDDLKKHPYIDFRIANNIVSFRNQHGAFESIADLRKIASLSSDLYDKIHLYMNIK